VRGRGAGPAQHLETIHVRQTQIQKDDAGLAGGSKV